MTKCDNCKQELSPISPAQSEYVAGKTFRLPFTDIHLTIFHNDRTIQYGCTDCIVDSNHEQQREVYEAGFSDGVARAERDVS